MKKSNKLKKAIVARKRGQRKQQQSKRTERQRAAIANARTPAPLDLSLCRSEYSLLHDPRPMGRVRNNTPMVGTGEGPTESFGLSEDFRKSLTWRAPSVEENRHYGSNGAAVQLVQCVGLDYYKIRDNRLIAYDRSSFSADANLEYAAEASHFWDERIGETWRPKLDFVKAGPAIWKSLNFPMSVESSRFFLSLKKCDEATSDAFHAALFNAVNTSPMPVNWEAVILALATFVHAHPAFIDVIEDGAFLQPFGENTGWKLTKPIAA